MKSLAIIALLFATLSNAEVVTSAGLGKSVLADKPFERIAAIGYQAKLASDVFFRPELGYFSDLTGRGESSAFISGILLLEVSGFHVGVGPSYLSNPDSVLGGFYQFNTELGAGVRDEHLYLGVIYKHLSSAGIEEPNKGRDFLMLQIGFEGL